MASDLCLSLTKYFMFVFNLIFFFLGSALLSLGLWIMFSQTSFFIPAPHYLSLALFSYLLIISGSVTILLGFFGSLGALKEIKCMLALYFSLLSVLAAAQTVGGVLLVTQRSAFEETLDQSVKQIIHEFGKNESSLRDFELTLMALQQEAQCCGWDGPEDWETKKPCSCYPPVNFTGDVTGQSSICPLCDTHSNQTCEAFTTGCKDLVDEWLTQHILIIIGVVFALLVVEICGTILSMCLYKQGSMNYKLTLYH